MDSLNFDDITPIEVPVTINKKSYVLREANEAGAARYKNAQFKAMKLAEGIDGSKTSSIDGMAETEALLVSVCLFEKTENGGEKNVPIEEIKRLPHRVIEPLFKRAEEISGLQNKESKEDLVKKIKECQGKLAKIKANESSDSEDAQLKN
jgi:hypothetical protein